MPSTHDAQAERWTQATLKSRGWTVRLIRRFLDPPDALAPNPHYRSAGAPMKLCGHPPRPEVRGFHLTDIIAAVGHRAQRPQEPLYPPLEKEGFSERAPLIMPNACAPWKPRTRSPRH